MSKAFENEILKSLERLTSEQQQKALAYINTLPIQEKTSKSLIQLAGAMDQKSIREISEAIELGCETVDKNDW